VPKLGLLIPSTNVTAEPEYHELVAGRATVHTGRMLVSDVRIGSNASYLHLNDQMLAEMVPASENLATCEPDHVCFGMAATSFLGGVKGDLEINARLEGVLHAPVTSAPTAFVAALERIGASSVSLLSPFQPAIEGKVVDYFHEVGLEVRGARSFLPSQTTAIATVAQAAKRDVLQASADDGSDAICQLGTNLPLLFESRAATWWLGVPVLHVNVVMAEHALASLAGELDLGGSPPHGEIHQTREGHQ
jgi:maleate isomerase